MDQQQILIFGLLFAIMYYCISKKEGYDTSAQQSPQQSAPNASNATNASIGESLGWSNPNKDWNASGFQNDYNPARADVSVGSVLHDPFVRYDQNEVPLIYTNRHLTERELQSVDYVPRRIRPLRGPNGWKYHCTENTKPPLVQIMNNIKMPMTDRWHVALRLGMPSEFW